ncbi:hypothetical protein O181_077517 [Austropuccinia psidii MF-1]|uniref:Uncharacterized protein n=1 Tax=Austropuccinia psidii MF-1 TaxID=1389203 RepID=A0A9Q3FG40_9BASI|nr:hypothetical protein [Austropuccinia psidii MF-1]
MLVHFPTLPTTPPEECPHEDSFVVDNDESIPKKEWTPGPQTEQNPPNPPRQDSPIPHMPCKQTLRQPTPGPSGTQWLEDLSREPSQHHEPPLPGPSPSSEPPENVPTREPEPEVARTQSTEAPFARPATPCSVILIDNMPVISSPHSHDDACQDFTNLQPTLMIPLAIVHKSIIRILLENVCLLQMIPFVDAPGIQGGTKQPPLPGTGGLSKGGHHWDSLQISRKKIKTNLFPLI